MDRHIGNSRYLTLYVLIQYMSNFNMLQECLFKAIKISINLKVGFLS